MKHTILIISLLISAIVSYCQSDTPEIKVAINGYSSTTIRPGLPVIINISVLNPDNDKQELLTSLLPDSIKEMEGIRKLLDSIKAVTYYSDTIPEWFNRIIFSVWYKDNGKRLSVAKELLMPRPDAYFSLAPGYANLVDFGIDPEETKKWKQGTINIIAGFPLPEGNDTLWSEVAIINTEKDDLKEISEYSDEQLRFTAKYWIRRGRCSPASEYAEELLRRNPDSYLNLMMMAEVDICNNNNESALKFLRRSLTLFEQQADPDLFPPEYIHKLMNELQLKMMIKSDDRK